MGCREGDNVMLWEVLILWTVHVLKDTSWALKKTFCKDGRGSQHLLMHGYQLYADIILKQTLGYIRHMIRYMVGFPPKYMVLT